MIEGPTTFFVLIRLLQVKKGQRTHFFPTALLSSENLLVGLGFTTSNSADTDNVTYQRRAAAAEGMGARGAAAEPRPISNNRGAGLEGRGRWMRRGRS